MSTFSIKIKNWFSKYERHVSSASLVIGFIVDSLTLQRIDLLFENVILLSYLAISAIGITIFNLHRAGVLRFNFLEKVIFLFPVIIQFAFGGLFSGFVVFYSRSAALLTSWPFLLILVGILITGELIKGFYTKINYQFSILFTALFSYLIFSLPILMGIMDWWVFVLSGVLSLVVFYYFYRLLLRIAPDFFLPYKKPLFFRVSSIFLIIFVFYFANILPPIPLSLKEVGVYHQVIRTQDGYFLLSEEKHFFDRFRASQKVRISNGEPVYVFSSVFAPTDLKVNILHEWQHFDEKAARWNTYGTISFPIIGGADGGYRGYSVKTNIFPGKWRVNVTNSRGQVVGRINFTVSYEQSRPLVENVSI